MFEQFKNSIKESTEYKKVVSVLSAFLDWVCQDFCFGILRKFDRKFIKFLFVGALNTAFSYVIYAICATFIKEATVALFLSYILGILFNFQTTGRIVFKNKDNSLLFKFILSYIFTFLINSYCLKTLIDTLGVNKYLSQAILVLPIAMLSFMIFKNFVFKEKN